MAAHKAGVSSKFLRLVVGNAGQDHRPTILELSDRQGVSAHGIHPNKALASGS
jgi:hypothetical protein